VTFASDRTTPSGDAIIWLDTGPWLVPLPCDVPATQKTASTNVEAAPFTCGRE